MLHVYAKVVHTVNMTKAKRGVLSTPDKTWLRHHARAGMTQVQMVAAWEKESGVRVSRSAIAMAMHRHGVEAAKPRPRYEDTLPWHVLDEHKYNSQARLLRLEGRRRKGGKLNDKELHWLTTWRRELEAHNAVIMYDPDTEDGFHWVTRQASDDDIVRRPVNL
jgi:hypothetical protein